MSFEYNDNKFSDSFRLLNISQRIPNWRVIHSLLTLHGPEMQHPKLIWHSSMLQVIKELYQSIKERPNYILRLLQMVATRAHKWR